MRPACVEDYRLLAQKRLPRFLFDYIDGGSYSEETMRSNVADLQRLRLHQKVMRDVSSVNLATTLFNRPASMPVGLGPVGIAGLYARRGEVQAAKAAERAGIPFILSASSCCGIEEVAAASDEPPIFQLYMIKDRGFMEAMLERAWASGVKTLVMTIDLIVHSARYRDVRSSLTGSQGLGAQLRRLTEIARHPRWAWDVGIRGRPHILGNFAPVMTEGAGLSQFIAWVSRNFDPSITWDDLAWIKARWKGQLVLKGVLNTNDARCAVDVGADGIVVSNHGGRQLDGAPSAIATLRAIAEAVGGRTEVLMDGGIRSGIDVLRALGLGAKGVLLGRAWAFALAGSGGNGVSEMLALLRHELLIAMSLTGQTDVCALDQDLIVSEGPITS